MIRPPGIVRYDGPLSLLRNVPVESVKLLTCGRLTKPKPHSRNSAIQEGYATEWGICRQPGRGQGKVKKELPAEGDHQPSSPVPTIGHNKHLTFASVTSQSTL
ncbi:hypothetical protein CBL_06165 [Carabus blaptoides fortunei]